MRYPQQKWGCFENWGESVKKLAFVILCVFKKKLIGVLAGFSLSWIYTLASSSVLIVQGCMSAMNGPIPIFLPFKLLSLNRVVWLSKWRRERIYPQNTFKLMNWSKNVCFTRSVILYRVNFHRKATEGTAGNFFGLIYSAIVFLYSIMYF